MIALLPILLAALAVVFHAVIHRFWVAVAMVTAAPLVLAVVVAVREPAGFSDPLFYAHTALFMVVGFTASFAIGLAFEMRRQRNTSYS